MKNDQALRDRMMGKLLFPGDESRKKLNYALLVRAPAPGILEEVKIPPKVSEDILIIQGKDVPGKNVLPFPDADFPLLVEREVLYPGQGVALLVGPDPKDLFQLKEKIHLTLTPWEKDYREDFEGQMTYQRTIRRGNLKEGQELAEGRIQGSLTMVNPEIPHFPGCDVFCVKEGGAYILNVHTQWPNLLRRMVALAGGVSRKQIKIKTSPTGSSWGGYFWQAAHNAALAVCATALLRRPTKFINEACEGKTPQYELQYDYEIGYNKQGRLQFFKGHIHTQVGAYPLFASSFFPRLLAGAAGIYTCPHMELTVEARRSFGPPSLPLYTWGMGQGVIGTEFIINKAVEAMETLPGEWRQKRFLSKGNTSLFSERILAKSPLVEMIEGIEGASDFKRKYASHRQIQLNSKLLKMPPLHYRGIGMGCTQLGMDFVDGDKALTAGSVSLTLQKDGRVRLELSVIPSSDRIVDLWKNQVAQALGVEASQVEICLDSPDENILSGPSVLSRNITVYTDLIQRCCESIQKKRFREGLPITEVRSYRRRPKKDWDHETMTGRPFAYPSWAVAVVELSISASTRELSIPHIWLTIHCGKLLIPSLAQATVEGEIRLALTHCVEKEAITPSLFPKLHINFVGTGKPRGLEGLAFSTVIPAFIQALSQAAAKEVVKYPVNSGGFLRGDL